MAHNIQEAITMIGDVLLDHVSRTRSGIRWPAPFDRSLPGKVEISSFAHGALYDGCAGIASVLADLEVNVPRRGYGEIALEAIAEARHWIGTSHSFGVGLHTGRAGIALSTLRVGRALGNADIQALATEEFKALIRELEQDRPRCSDIISGDAGVILALLSVHESSVVASPAAEAACWLGDRLLRSAHRTARGWQWDDEIYASDGLTGYAHGASGVAHALISLAVHPRTPHVARPGRYFAAALLALEYERSHYSDSKHNWADLRVDPDILSDPEKARDALLALLGSTKSENRYMIAWCHGTPGACIPRAILLRHLEDRSTRVELDDAISTLCATPQLVAPRASLCHSAPGNIEILRSILPDLTSPPISLRAAASVEDTTQRVLSQLPLLLRSHVEEQSFGLMTGLAGILHFLLRQVSPEIPSWLSIEPPSVRNPLQSTEFSSDVESFLAEETRRCMPRLGKFYSDIPTGSLEIGTGFLDQYSRSIGETALRDVGDSPSASPVSQAKLRQALSLDFHERALLASVDRFRDRLEATVTSSDGDPIKDDDLLILSGRVRAVNQPTINLSTLLVRNALTVEEHPLGLLAQTILDTLSQPITLVQLRTRLIKEDCPSLDRDRLEDLIVRQAMSLRDAGILTHIREGFVRGNAA